MCGLAGTASLDGHPLGGGAASLLDRMATCVAHRGPDDRQVLLDGPVGLAFTRLSLLDAEGGAQPLISPDGNVVLIANGEIYNHRELAERYGFTMRSGSDCEVLVHLYQRFGLGFMDEVRGMIAIVLWDRAQGRLLLARDHFGIKPLYFHRSGTRIVFASEIKALFSDPATPAALDWSGALADQALTAAAVFDTSQPRTWFQGIESVPAATVLDIRLDDGHTTSHVYWTRPEPGDDPLSLSDDEFIEAFRETLSDSVAACVDADASIGLFLSGGIDSAAVAALARRGGVEVETFSVLSGSTLLSGDAPMAHRVASDLGLTNHQVLFPAPAVPEVEEWRRLLWLTEMPTCGPEQYFKQALHRFARHHRPELKGMLLGAAADEFCGGYATWLTSQDGSWADFEEFVTSMARDTALSSRPGLTAWQEDCDLLGDDALDLSGRDPYRDFVAWKFRDIQQYNCWHEDRTAAGNGIEARVPFLDTRLVELVSRIPREQRGSLLWDKRILRESVRGMLPDEVVDRPKVPFYHGDGARQTHLAFIAMLQRDGGALLDEALSSPGGKSWLDADAVRGRVRELAADPDSGPVERVLRLVNMGLLDAMVRDQPAPLVHARVGAVPPALDAAGWEQENALARIENIVLIRPRVDDDTVMDFADGAELVARRVHGEYYVTLDATIEYTLDEAEAPDWVGLLTGVDGSRSVGALADAVGLDRPAAIELVRQAIEWRVLAEVTS